MINNTINAVRRLSLPLVRKSDVALLNEWRFAPLTCTPQIYENFEEAMNLSVREKDWKVVSYREVFPHENISPATAIDCARRVILHFENVMPPSVAMVTGDWQDTSRDMEVGDRFVQRVDLLPFGMFRGVMGQVCMDEVVHIYDNDKKCGFTVVTTDKHDEIGEHTLWVRSEDSGKNRLILESVSASTFKSHVFGPGLRYARWLQRRAHSLGCEYLRRNVGIELKKAQEQEK